MQIEVTPCSSDWQKFKRMLTPTTDGGEKKSVFSYISFKKRIDTAFSGSYVEKSLFKKFKFPSTYQMPLVRIRLIEINRSTHMEEYVKVQKHL